MEKEEQKQRERWRLRSFQRLVVGEVEGSWGAEGNVLLQLRNDFDAICRVKIIRILRRWG